MEATAKYDYEATVNEELSFRKEELLMVLQTSGNWYTAELNGREGLVPKNFININLPSWYREDFSRGDAEEKLMQQPVGAFLLRGSRKAVLGDFSISVRHPENVQHFKVLRDSRGRYYLWSEKFPSLNQLVEYYKHNSISIESQMVLLETPHLFVSPQQRGSQDAPPLPAPPPASCPPPPSPPPAAARQVRALYSFHAEEMDELTFNAGDVILVLERSDRAWWRGRVGGRTGLFPSNYTQPV
ncbi:GRB2-related adapter protein 2b isoform X1 [Cyclopterus lumpus]|uniref:GRB2-related adapter protein 2b isoform X1 n=1 Tax=Cyclopterus lumpus TaxID=8103 RepID=UPI001486632E|nr:GRB2-related adapter protein 2b isoform X1 [Cyclopterus lumpus]